jgi:hypothetical protein
MAVLLLALSLPAAAQEPDESKPSFEIYGFTQLDYIQDFNRVDPAWEATLRPTRIPTTGGTFGSNIQATLSARQSRLGVDGSIPTDRGPIKAKFEFDLFGVGADEGQFTIRPRHIYGEWNHVLGGQTNSLFMDVDIFPNIIDYWGPAGMVFLRNPQIRWTPIVDSPKPFNGKNSLAVALEQPGNNVDPGQVREVDPGLGAGIISDEKVPDFTAQYRNEADYGHVQVAGILRDVGFETAGNPGNLPSGRKLGWGVDVTSNLKTKGDDKFCLGVVFGDGIANYMNDGGVDLAPKTSGASILPVAVPLIGVSAYYDWWWDKYWSSSAGYSRTQVDNPNFQSRAAFRIGQYASANLIWHPSKEVFFGGEFLWGQRVDVSGANGVDHRVQFSAHYNFSSSHRIPPQNPEK